MAHFRAAGPQAWLVITGDLVHGPDDDTVANWPEYLGTPYCDETPALVKALIGAQAQHPDRVFCLLGNHDHSHVGGPATAKFHDDERLALENRLDEPAREELVALIKTFPLAAVAPCGAVMTHAAPAAPIVSIDELETAKLEGYENWDFQSFLDVPVIGPLLWARMAKPAQSQQFLKAMGGTVALFGHDIVREGFAREQADQLCFSTSFGLFDENKVYVELDLASKYPNALAIREGLEIKKLWPAVV